MKIYNEAKTQQLNETEIDYEKGYLKSDKLVINHHDAVPAKTVEEQIVELTSQDIEIEKHYDNNEKKDKFYRVLAVYPSGGKDAEEIIDIPAKEAYDDYEDIQVYIPFTEQELKERADGKELAELKKWFIDIYDVQVKQYERCQRLGLPYDNKYGTIDELDEKANLNAARINELRAR